MRLHKLLVIGDSVLAEAMCNKYEDMKKKATYS
jgi:hypothetical protein